MEGGGLFYFVAGAGAAALVGVAVGTMSDYTRSTSGSFTYEEGPPLPFLGFQPLLRIASSQNEFPTTKEGHITFKKKKFIYIFYGKIYKN